MTEQNPITPEELSQEIWKPVPGWEGRYDVSDFGRVRSWVRKVGKHSDSFRVFKPGKDTSGYPHVGFRDNGKPYCFKVHRLVMLAFVGPCPEGKEVNHIGHDGDKANNRLSNLEYVTRLENMQHAIKYLGWNEKKASGWRHGSVTHPECVPRGDRNGSKTHPECVPRGDNHHSRVHPERMARGDRHSSRTHPERLPRGECHFKSKLTNLQISVIRHLRGFFPKISYSDIGEIFGVDRTTISLICRGKTWKHVVSPCE